MTELAEKTGMEGTTGNWTESEAGFTPEMKTAFAKYNSKDEAFKGAYEAQKQVGRPYKLPESLDKLDEKTRGEFTAGLNKLTGAVEKAEDLKDINFAAGLPEGVKPNDAIIGALSNFAVENHIPKSLIAKYAEYSNKMGTEMRVKMAQSQEADFIAKAKACDDALIADPNYGTIGKVQEADELARRMYMKYSGLNAEEYEQAGNDLANSGFTRYPVLRKALHNQARQLVKEGSSEAGAGGAPPPAKELTKYEQNKIRWPNTPDLWGDPNAV